MSLYSLPIIVSVLPVTRGWRETNRSKRDLQTACKESRLRLSAIGHDISRVAIPTSMGKFLIDILPYPQL